MTEWKIKDKDYSMLDRITSLQVKESRSGELSVCKNAYDSRHQDTKLLFSPLFWIR